MAAPEESHKRALENDEDNDLERNDEEVAEPSKRTKVEEDDGEEDRPQDDESVVKGN